jgi:hypothetical protein
MDTPREVCGGIRTPGWWAATFARLEREGFFASEPDAPLAIRLHREAVERGDPMTVEWEWVAEMYTRISKGKPPVTEAEYEELKAWYFKHEATESVYDANIRHAFINTGTRSPRRVSVTALIERLRTLRAEHPDLP